jgi:MFS family permease
MIIVALSYILMGLFNYWPILIIFIFISSGIGLGIKPIYISYMNKYIPSNKRATILSTISMCRQITIVIGNIIIGFVMNYSSRIAIISLGILIGVFALISKVEEKHLKD